MYSEPQAKIYEIREHRLALSGVTYKLFLSKNISLQKKTKRLDTASAACYPLLVRSVPRSVGDVESGRREKVELTNRFCRPLLLTAFRSKDVICEGS